MALVLQHRPAHLSVGTVQCWACAAPAPSLHISVVAQLALQQDSSKSVALVLRTLLPIVHHGLKFPEPWRALQAKTPDPLAPEVASLPASEPPQQPPPVGPGGQGPAPKGHPKEAPQPPRESSQAPSAPQGPAPGPQQSAFAAPPLQVRYEITAVRKWKADGDVQLADAAGWVGRGGSSWRLVCLLCGSVGCWWLVWVRSQEKKDKLRELVE